MKKLLLLLVLCSSISFGQTTVANKLKITGNSKQNGNTRVMVGDSLSKEVNFIMKSSLLNRANHTGEQPISSITNLQDSLSLARTNIDNINNQIANPNISEILVETGFTLVGQDLTMNTGWEWKINDVLYANVAPQVINIPLAATGMSRIDIIVCNTSNTFTRIIGTESSSSPNAPPIPLNTLQATFLVVDDLVIEPPVPTVTSNLYIPKADKSKILVPGNSTTLSAGKFAQTIAFELAGAHTTISKVYWFNNRNSYNGRVLTIKNSENSDVTITHDSNIGLGHPFFFHNGQDYTLEPNEVIEFSYNSVTSKFDMIGKIQSSSANYWTANGNDIYKNNSGNVGINTTTPQNKLEISSGTTDNSGVRLKDLYSTLYQSTVLIPTTDATTLALTGSAAKASNATGIYWYNGNQIKKTTFAGVTTNYVSTIGVVQSMAFDSVGNLFWTVAGSGILFKSIVGAPSPPVEISGGSLVTPTAIAIDSNNNVFVADFNLNYVTKLANSATGAVTTHGTFHPNLGGAYGSGIITMCVTPLGDLFIARSNNNTRLSTILANGTSNTVLNGTGCGVLNMLSDSQGYVYTLDYICENVMKISQDGTTILWTIPMTNPYGITIENDNKVMICDRSSPGGVYEVSTGVKITYSSLLTNLPISISKDGLGNYYTTNMTAPPLTKIWATKENKAIILNGDGDIIPTTSLKIDKNNIVTAPFNSYATLSNSPIAYALLTTEYLPYLQAYKSIGSTSTYKIITGGTATGNTRSSLYYITNPGEYTTDTGRNTWEGYGFLHGAVSYGSSIFGTYAAKSKGYYSTTLGGEVLQTDSYGEVAMGFYNTTPSTGNQSSKVATDRLFTLGNGTFSVKSDAIKVLKNGLMTLPSVTNALITAEATGKAVVTKEYLSSEISGKQNTLSLTTTGTSGVATLTGDTLNVPNYTSVPSPITIVNTNSLFSTGLGAGSNSTATYSNFIGTNSGINSTNASNSNFLGRNSGQNSTDAHDSNFLGPFAGADAVEAHNSNFIGKEAGVDAVNAHNSTFIGQWTGYNAMEASYSNLFGYNVGNGSELGTIGSNNIIIGTNISLPTTTVNSINLGGVLFGTGAYSTIIGDPSIVPVAAGRIGVGVVSPSTKLHVYSETADTSGLRLERLTSTSPTSTGQAIGVDTSGNVVTINGGTSTLETYTEGGQTGYRLSASDPLNYGNIGTDATDFSYSGTASATMGSTGEGSFTTGEENTSSAYGATTFNYKNTNASVEGLIGGANNQSAGYVNHILGTGNDVTGTNITVVGQAANIIAESTASNNIGTSPVFVVGNGTITDASDYVVATRSDALIVRKNGVLEAPSLSIAEIDAGTDQTVVTREWVKKITVRKISTATTLADSDNGNVILLTASCTVTLPDSLVTGFNCSIATQAGATLTYSLGGSVILINNSTTTMPPLSSHTLVNTGVANEYLTVGL